MKQPATAREHGSIVVVRLLHRSSAGENLEVDKPIENRRGRRASTQLATTIAFTSKPKQPEWFLFCARARILDAPRSQPLTEKPVQSQRRRRGPYTPAHPRDPALEGVGVFCPARPPSPRGVACSLPGVWSCGGAV